MNGYDPDSPRPGLAAERTDLAWNRSGLSLLACGVAVLRGLARTPLTSGHFAEGLCILALGGFTWALGSWRARSLRTQGARRTTLADLLPISMGVALVGTIAFVVAAIAPA